MTTKSFSEVLFQLNAAVIYCYRVAWSVCGYVCLSVCQLVTFMSPAEMDEPIEMPLDGGLGDLGRLRWRPRSPQKKGNFVGCPVHCQSV